MIPSEVKQDFCLTGEGVLLSGGQGTSFRIDNAVVKQVEDTVYSETVLSIVDQLSPVNYRVAKPLKTKENTFIGHGWQCTQYENGEEKQGKLKEKLAVSRALHHDLKQVKIEVLTGGIKPNDPWSMAHRVAWGQIQIPADINQKAAKVLKRLLNNLALREYDDFQIIHGDLAGNILFDKILPPLVIDFSPTIAPVAYAEAILIVDCIAWQGSDITNIDWLSNNDDMLIRAVIFRLTVEAVFAGNDEQRFSKQYELFHPIIQFVYKRHP